MTSSLSSTNHQEPKPPRVSLRNVSKTFGHTRALSNVTLELFGGEIHALCGQNGSGKSTIIKILSAYHTPEAGAELTIDGESIKLPLDPGQPEKLGIRFVHQDLALAPKLTVLDNLYIEGYPRHRGGLIRWRAARRAARATLARFDLDVALDRTVDSLSAAQRAILAIARAMQHGGDRGSGTRVLVLDEPTAHLPASDVARLMDAIREARADNVAVMLVTHRLEEVLEYTDRATVLRDGRRIGTYPVASLDHDRLVELLLGRSLDSQYPTVPPQRGGSLVELRNFSTGRATQVSFSVDEGEIVGITGLIGAGFEDLPYGVFGAASSDGEVLLHGQLLDASHPDQAIRAGMALVPADRITQAGVASATLVENLTLPTLQAHTWGPFINRRREARAAAAVMRQYDVRPDGPVTRHLSVLSGGNQQKLLVAKWLESEPSLLLLHEPTQGVDIGSRRQLFDLVVAAAGRGCGVIFASADYADLASLCHRVLVFRRGRVVASMSDSELDEDRIAERCLRDAGAPAS